MFLLNLLFFDMTQRFALWVLEEEVTGSFPVGPIWDTKYSKFFLAWMVRVRPGVYFIAVVTLGIGNTLVWDQVRNVLVWRIKSFMEFQTNRVIAFSNKVYTTVCYYTAYDYARDGSTYALIYWVII